MKKLFYRLIIIGGLLGCQHKKVIDLNKSTVAINTNEIIKLHKLDKLFVTGDFDGDKQIDTLFQHNYSQLTGIEIDSSADPFQNEWDSVVHWFYQQNSDVYLSLNKTNKDTLHLGTAQGLYCLINIGDNNTDVKDEVALVIDYLDFSRVNSCKIFSLCHDNWTLQKQFDIHEGAFDFIGDKIPVFKSIKDFLENKNGQWMYADYTQIAEEKEDDVGKMKKLMIDKCK